MKKSVFTYLYKYHLGKFLLIFLTCLAKSNQAFSKEKLTGVASAEVLKITEVSSESNEVNFRYNIRGHKFIGDSETEINYDASGNANSYFNSELMGLDGKKFINSDGQKFLPIDLKNENGTSIKAEIYFLNDGLIFDKKGQAHFKSVLKINRFVTKPNKKPSGIFKAGYYVKIQH